MPDIRISTIGLASPSFNVVGGPAGFVNGQTSPPPAVTLPVRNGYRFQQAGGVPASFTFDVTPEGTVRYDEERFGAFLDGLNTDTLHVVGFPFALDTTALSHSVLLRLSGANFLPPGTHPLRLPPAANYGFQSGGGVLSPLLFGIDLDGSVTLDSRFSSFAGVSGGTTLQIRGHPMTVDGTRLSHDLLPMGMAGMTRFLERTDTHRITVLPAQGYGFQPGGGVIGDLRFGVDIGGAITLDPKFGSFARVTAGPTLEIGGHTITVDGTRLSHDVAPLGMRTAAGFLERATPHDLTVLPAKGYGFQPGGGVLSDLRFGVELDGTIILDPKFAGSGSGGGSRALVLLGHPVTIDGTALSHDLIPLSLARVDPRIFDRTRTHSLKVLPARGHLLAAASGVVADLSFDITTAGTIDYPQNCDRFLGGRGSTTLQVRGYPIIVDARNADSDLVGVVNIPVRPTNGEELFANMVPGAGYLPQTRNGVFRTPFGIERDGDITFDPTVEGKYVVRRASTPNPSQVGEDVTLTVVVNPAPPALGTPSGHVAFLDGGSELGTALLDGQGRAVFRVATLAAGEHEIVVEYRGDRNFAPSSARLRHRVE